jgi:PilZ domain-containing protein
MEHRWGERVPVQMTVELSCGSSPPVSGSLENVSSSGAFVRTAGRRPPRGPIEVLLGSRGSGRGHCVRIPAHVVRETDTGVGIEWSEFAPRAVRELMLRGAGAGRPPVRARAPRANRHSPGALERETQPSAGSGAEPAAADTNLVPIPSAGPPMLVTAARS